MARKKFITALFALMLLPASVMAEPEGLEHGGLNADRRVLKSGLTVLHVERDNLPIVRVSLLIRSGAMHEPPELAGLASLTASLLSEGTRSRSAREISSEVEYMGASLGASATDDYTSLSLSVLKKDLNKGFELLTDILLEPTFPRKEVKRKREQVKSALKKSRENPSHLASVAFEEMVYGDHPYGRLVSGDEESLDRIGRRDIRKFYSAHYRPDNAILSVVGMVSPAELDELIAQYLPGWEKADSPGSKDAPAHEAPPPLSAGSSTRTIDRELTQANIILGHLGVSRSHPDYYALQVMNYILGGGGFSSRMMDRLRDQLGLTYGVYSSFSAKLDAGAFYVRMQTKNSAASKAMDEIRSMVTAMRDEGVTVDELKGAKAYLTGSFPRRIDTMAEIASFLAQVEFHGLGLDYPQRYAQMINAVTLDEIKRVAQKHLRVEDLVVVVVADLEQAGLVQGGDEGPDESPDTGGE